MVVQIVIPLFTELDLLQVDLEPDVTDEHVFQRKRLLQRFRSGLLGELCDVPRLDLLTRPRGFA